MKKRKKQIGILAAVILIISMVFGSAFAATEDEWNAQKNAAEEAKEAAQYQVDMTQNTIDGITEEIEKADAAIAEIAIKINDLEDQIGTTNLELEQLEAELTETIQKKNQQQADLEERMRVMYMYGTEGYAEILFSSQSVGDLIERVEVVLAVMDADEQALDALKDAQKKIEDKQTEIEAKKQNLTEQKAEQEELQRAQEDIKAQQNELLAQNSAVLAEYQAEVAAQDAAIKEAEDALAKIAVEKQRQVQQSSGSSGSSSAGSSSYIWPSDYTSITSYFGYRTPPCAGASSYHEGIDIGASYGSAIYACAGGTVTYAGWSGGYGYCVMIAHPSGYTTLYGHMSSIAVYEGEYVSQGEVIGYCGSTGVSTGPHIHLSFINSSGTFVDPLDFL